MSGCQNVFSQTVLESLVLCTSYCVCVMYGDGKYLDFKCTISQSSQGQTLCQINALKGRDDFHASSIYLQISLCYGPESLGFPRIPRSHSHSPERRCLCLSQGMTQHDVTTETRRSIFVPKSLGPLRLTSMAIMEKGVTSIIQQRIDFQT